MIPTFRILIRMGSLHRLFPLWLIGVACLFLWFSPWLLLAVAYGAAVGGSSSKPRRDVLFMAWRK